jgi:hypothetical protein
MWLACGTQEEIASATDCDQATVKRTIDGFMQIVSENQTHKSTANHADESFQIPLYNVWKQQEKTPGSHHFGNSEVQSFTL